MEKIEPALPEDAEALSKISFAAKKHWGYPDEWMEAWKNDLIITREYITTHSVFKLLIDTELIGFCAIEQQHEYLEVTHLWIKPGYIGNGLGKRLLHTAIHKVRQHNPAPLIKVVADPNAEAFYRKSGFTTVSFIESTPKGRYLPVMEKAAN